MFLLIEIPCSYHILPKIIFSPTLLNILIGEGIMLLNNVTRMVGTYINWYISRRKEETRCYIFALYSV